MKYYSITVAYHPNENLESQIRCLQSAGIVPIVVFNSVYQGELDKLRDIKIIKNDANLGLAKAINLGVSRAISEGSEAFFLFDQDSIPNVDMIEKILDKAKYLSRNHINWGSIGPSIFNQSDNSIWPVPISPDGRLRFIRQLDEDLVEVDYLITSGIFISSQIWNIVGSYLEDFFIDGLDIEWGYRTKSLGYKNFISRDARLVHNLGDKALSIFPFLKKRMIVHSAMRRFYIYRNYLWMFRLTYIPKEFKIHYGKKLVKMFVGILISPYQWSSIPKILKGIWFGIFFHSKSISNPT